MDLTTATLTFGREEPEAYHRYREAYFRRTGQPPASASGANGEAAVTAFENRVADARRQDPSLDAAAAIVKVAAEHPDLARARTIALSTPIGPGGVVRRGSAVVGGEKPSRGFMSRAAVATRRGRSAL